MAGVPVKIVTNRAVSRAVLRIVGIDELAPVYDTVDKALASLSNGNGAQRSNHADGQSDAPNTA
ncbi:hypothetical protein ABCR94_11255 [Streptomyces sp. 21So2-11]|uniref:hypothetical protein n=1 Tax=Streptomyces sp. 21So2-11 TaxID=3144408 RepID=UPI00321B4968